MRSSSLDFIDSHEVVAMLKAVCLLDCKILEYNETLTSAGSGRIICELLFTQRNCYSIYLIADDKKKALIYKSRVVYISKSTVNDYCFNLLCIAYIFYRICRKNNDISLLFRLYRAHHIINT